MPTLIPALLDIRVKKLTSLAWSFGFERTQPDAVVLQHFSVSQFGVSVECS